MRSCSSGSHVDLWLGNSTNCDIVCLPVKEFSIVTFCVHGDECGYLSSTQTRGPEQIWWIRNKLGPLGAVDHTTVLMFTLVQSISSIRLTRSHQFLWFLRTPLTSILLLLDLLAPAHL